MLVVRLPDRLGTPGGNALPGVAHDCSAEQILLGKAAEGKIRIDTLQRFALVVNMKTATGLGVYPPLDLIKIAELL